MGKVKKFAVAITRFFDAWSWSRLVDWESCPRNAALSHLMKMGRFENEAMIRGRDIHVRAGNFLEGKGKLPPECKSFSKEMQRLKTLKPLVEERAKLCFDKDWNIVDWFDMKRARLRVTLDARAWLPKLPTIIVVDHKSGRHRTEEVVKYGQQMKLYAAAIFAAEPKVETVDTRIWFHDAGQEESEEFYRKDWPALRHYWEVRAAPMLADRAFNPKPGIDACRFCRHGISKGGPCHDEVKQ